jgi:capsular polysaccharide biosynthesis protein
MEMMVIYHEDKRSQEEKIREFQRASMVMGMHGGLFSFLPYCHRTTKVYEINIPTRPGRRDFFGGLSRTMGLEYYRYPLRFQYGAQNESDYGVMTDRDRNLFVRLLDDTA